ncbi:ABC transporter ATP-binding protein [Lysinibacillus sphaericus]|uniref:Sodium ABC transporter ATP-binding protein n=4 Tax=Lysinibacillus TaxID=400634 RepID=A0A2S0K1N8_LYSSH|nr:MULTISPECIES: ABC transporter ATP-binding protein [Lysinibacillus]AHN21564.1 sodium ABC transporter ATP-binding protein [Lysinibacillus varians]AVK97313.1 sodium ABC transporter ATP-binding protein [Lysinibacillus sphaericus]MCS1382238.1 ABC transporter ATP-binding protein [Lysinibacillus sphaericus]MED4542618.1 ABC transporter ATP-binding protein [Lysinibacillus sphaericus]TKI19999.1 ABC transporter ATP-binding protein [Lysinibacillus sphaericus]
MTLQLQHVTKKYKDFTAVDNLNFTIEKGEIFGLIGQNGAGKTTTFRMILDLQETTAGTISWNGKPVNSINRDVLGYLPEERGIFPTMKVEDQLYFFGELRGMKKAALKKDIDFWISRFELEEKRKDKAETLSKGNQQKVQLIASFIHKPQFLILDEPFSGLDPVNKDLLKDAILLLKEQGTTILFSSHQMDNVEELCDHLCLLKRGVSLFSGSLLDLKKQYGKTKLSVRSNWSTTELLQLEGVKDVRVEKEQTVLLLEDERFAESIFQQLSAGKYIEKFSLDYLTLDEIFKDKVGGTVVEV